MRANRFGSNGSDVGTTPGPSGRWGNYGGQPRMGGVPSVPAGKKRSNQFTPMAPSTWHRVNGIKMSAKRVDRLAKQLGVTSAYQIPGYQGEIAKMGRAAIPVKGKSPFGGTLGADPPREPTSVVAPQIEAGSADLPLKTERTKYLGDIYAQSRPQLTADSDNGSQNAVSWAAFMAGVEALEENGDLDMELFASLSEEANSILSLLPYEERDYYFEQFYSYAPFDVEELGTTPAPVEKAPEDVYDQEVAAPVPQMLAHDMNLPEEPETVLVKLRLWDGQQWAFQDQGPRLLVPTGCDKPTYANPYETSVKLKPSLPRDRQELANYLAALQTNGWIHRHEAIKRLDEGLQPGDVDKGIMDDGPIMDILKGIPDPNGGAAQIAQTEGNGSSNGAPPPPLPGPGRGNKYTPGDNMAGKAAPPNGAPGAGV